MSDGLLLLSKSLLVCCKYDVCPPTLATLLPGERQYGKCNLRKKYVHHEKVLSFIAVGTKDADYS